MEMLDSNEKSQHTPVSLTYKKEPPRVYNLFVTRGEQIAFQRRAETL